MIYFTADLHFNHNNIIKHTGRPFQNFEEMDRALIKNWNQKVRPRDEVYILGDVTMKGPDVAKAAMTQLNGRKYLVRGNHDNFVDSKGFDPSIFEWVKDYHRMVYKGQRIMLFHYPIEEWDQMLRGAIHLHGHQHNKPEYNYTNAKNGIWRFDVGVDANFLAPISIDDVFSFMTLKD